eukprot:362640_1
MGNKNCKCYENTKHCCITKCFKPMKKYSRMIEVTNITTWIFTTKHQKPLLDFLQSEFSIIEDNLIEIIGSYLPNLNNTSNDILQPYKSHIHNNISPISDIYSPCKYFLQSLPFAIHTHSQEISYPVLYITTNMYDSVVLTHRSVYNEYLDIMNYDPTIGTYIDTNVYSTIYDLNKDKRLHENGDNIVQIMDKFNEHDSDLYSINNEHDKDLTYVTNDNKYSKDISKIYLNILHQTGGEYFSRYGDRYSATNIFILSFPCCHGNKESFDAAMAEGKHILNPVYTQIKENDEYVYKSVNRNNRQAIIFVGTRKHLIYDSAEYMNFNYVTQKLKENGFDGYPYVEVSAKEGRNVHYLLKICLYEYWFQVYGNEYKHKNV